MARLDQITAKETPPVFWLEKFSGTNQHDDRRSIDDQEESWSENMDPLGAGNDRAMYDAATPIYTSSKAIVFDFPFNIAAVYYKALFFADGSALAQPITGAAGTVMGGAGTFAITPTLPDCAQWGASGIVIVAPNGFWAWDGTLHSAGAAAPAWLSGLAAPITTTGDTHTNTTVDNVADVTGIVVGMMITSGTGDIPAGTLVDVVTSGPNVITLSQAATGSNSTEALTINWPMPSGLSGNAVEIYQSRVWILRGASFSFSAPGNGSNFSTANGGGSVKSSDGFLKTTFVNLLQSNGFLYMFGDGSINVISNVQTTGSPATTTFNNQNVDPQTGLGWRDTLVPFGRAVCFANPTGAYALFGGAAEKISDKIDRLFEKADFTAVTPTMFVTSVFNVRCLGLILNTYDPSEQAQRTLIILWNGSKWFPASQSYTTTFGSTMEINANPQGWGNDGTRVYKLFATASSTLPKKIVTKLWPGRSQLINKTAMNVYAESVDYADTGVILTGTIDSDTRDSVAFSITSEVYWINNFGGLITFQNNLGQDLQFLSSPPGVQGTNCDQSGRRLGLTLNSTSPDFALIGLGLTYNEENWYGS